MNRSITTGARPNQSDAPHRSRFRLLALAVVVVIVAIFALAATKPDQFRVERSTRIDAPPEQIFPLISDLRSHTRWSPFETLDPDMRRTYSGAPSGTGARYAWESDGRGGIGRMEIIDARRPSTVLIDLDFVTPFETQNTVEFSLRRAGRSTEVTWAMYGPNPLVAKLMGVFVSMDRVVGADFEAGLNNLKRLAES